MGEWRIFGWSRSKKEPDQAIGAKQQGMQKDIASLSVLTEQLVQTGDFTVPLGVVTSDSILKTIYDPSRLPNYETARMIINGIFSEIFDGYISSETCEAAFNNRRLFELKRLEGDYLKTQNDLTKMGKSKRTTKNYLQVLEAKQSLTTFFFNNYWQLIDKERKRISDDLLPIEKPRDRLKERRKQLTPMLKEKSKEREILLREVFVLEKVNWTFIDAMKKIGETFSTIKSAMPYVASGIGYISVWPPEFVQKYVVEWASHFTVVDSFLRVNYPTIRGIAIMVGLGGIASLALKIKAKYAEYRRTKEDRRKKMEESIHLSSMMDLIQKKIDEVQKPIDVLSQERKRRIDNRTRLFKKSFDDILKEYEADMDEADYF